MTDEITFDTDEKLSSLIELDVLLADQYFATFRRKELEPEKQLMLAVLEDAVTCFQRYIFGRNRWARTLYNETEDWICDENTDYAFSFDNICAVFGLDPKYVRDGLLRWKKSKLAQRQQQIVRIPSARSEELIRNYTPAERLNESNGPVGKRRWRASVENF